MSNLPVSNRVHLALALESAGWHPAAWRDASAAPHALTKPSYWRELLRTADDAGLVLATIEDGLSLPTRFEQEPLRRDRVRGRLDAVLIASAVAPLTRRIGLVPTVTTAHPEPFHIATGIQTLDHTSLGRAGVRLVAGSSPAERANFGRRPTGPDALPASGRAEDSPEILAAFREAGEVADVLTRLWDSWQDDAIIRDLTTGRFIDADRVHYVDFEGEFFSVKGASIVPRSPQGRPLITALAHQTVPYRFAAEHADVVFITPADAAATAGILTEIGTAADEVRRGPLRDYALAPLRVFADLLVLIEDQTAAARDALARLDDLDGAPLASDARIVAGSPDDIVEEIRALADAGVDGVRLRPARQPADVRSIATTLVPRLRAAGLLHDDSSGPTTLRERLGLSRPASRYTTAEIREEVAL